MFGGFTGFFGRGGGNMTQDELWQWKYQGIVDFLKTHHRNLFKHRIKEELKLHQA